MADPNNQNQEETTRFTEPRLLIVEGTDEREFFDAFIRRMGREFPNIINIQILPGGGKDKQQTLINAIRITPGFNDTTNRVASIGIVRDADENPTSAFESVHNALQRARLPAPGRPLLPAGGTPQVVVMIMPGQGSTGALEDLCLSSVDKDPAIECIKTYFSCLEEKLPENEQPKNKSKAKVQAFLSSRREILRDLGTAAQKNYWGNWDHEVFSEIRQFLQILCSS